MGAAPGTKRRSTAAVPRRRRRRVDTRAANKAITAARNLTNQDFVEKYIIQPSERNSDDAAWPRWTHPETREQYALSLRSPEDIHDAELEACFGLVERTSGHDYRRAAGGWHPEAKRAEMRSPGLRYILVRGAAAEATSSDESATENSGGGEIRAFTSFMPTWEDNKPVVYCYEIHLLPELEGTGLGRLLMSHVTTTADRIGALHKTMLTCFTANARARRFYEKLGFAVDDSSPRPRRLRDKVVEPEYIILYRPTRSDDDADADAAVDVDATAAAAAAAAAADDEDDHREKRAKRVD